MVIRQIEKFVFLSTFFEHGYLAPYTAETLKILFVCTLLPYRGNGVSDF